MLPSTYLSLQAEGRGNASSLSAPAMPQTPLDDGTGGHRSDEIEQGMVMVARVTETKGDARHEERGAEVSEERATTREENVTRQSASQDSTRKLLPLSADSAENGVSTALPSSSLSCPPVPGDTDTLVRSSASLSSGDTRSSPGMVEAVEDKAAEDLVSDQTKRSQTIQRQPVWQSAFAAAASILHEEEGKENQSTYVGRGDAAATHRARQERQRRRLSDFSATFPLLSGTALPLQKRNRGTEEGGGGSQEDGRKQGGVALTCSSQRRRRSYGGERRIDSPAAMQGTGGGGGGAMTKNVEDLGFLLENRRVSLFREMAKEARRERERENNRGEEGDVKKKRYSDLGTIKFAEHPSVDGQAALRIGAAERSAGASPVGRGGEGGQGLMTERREEARAITDGKAVAERRNEGDDDGQGGRQQAKRKSHEEDEEEGEGGKRDTSEGQQVSVLESSSVSCCASSSSRVGGGDSRADKQTLRMEESVFCQEDVVMKESSPITLRGMEVGHPVTVDNNVQSKRQKEQGDGRQTLEKSLRDGMGNNIRSTCTSGEESSAVVLVPKDVEELKRKDGEEEEKDQKNFALALMTTTKSSKDESYNSLSSPSYCSVVVEVENLLWRFAAVVEEKKAMYVQLNHLPWVHCMQQRSILLQPINPFCLCPLVLLYIPEYSG